jgi:gliding-associated putative ABC transporter substrate-binding component GldG
MIKRLFSFKGIYNWSFLLLATIALVLINIIASLVYYRLDMTEDQRYSLSNGTKSFLADKNKFENRISIKIYLEGNLPAEIQHFRNALEDKLKIFKSLAGDRIEYIFVNPKNGSDSDQKALFSDLYARGQGILPMDIVYMKDGDQTPLMLWPGAQISYSQNGIIKESVIQFLPGTQPGKPYDLSNISEILENAVNNLEYNLVSAMRKITQLEKPRIAFLQGHGELNSNQTLRVRGLIAPYYSLSEISLNDSIAALADIDGLVIADPQYPFSDKDLYIIDQFVMNGGKLMCFMNALHIEDDTLMSRGITHSIRKNLRLENMLFDYGLKLNENLVVDVQCAPKIVPYAEQTLLPWFFHVMASPTSHPVSRNIEPVSLEYANEIQFVKQAKARFVPILTSSSNSNKTGLAPLVSLEMPMSYGKKPQLVDNPTDNINKLCLAGLSEGYYNSHFQNRIVEEFSKNKNSNYKEKSLKETKVLLVGNGNFIANSYDSIPNPKGAGFLYRANPFNELKFNKILAERSIPYFYGNQEFFQNLMDYMMGDNSVLDIRSRQIDIKLIDKEKLKVMSGRLKIINVFGPVLLILFFAFIWNVLRKKRYSKITN